MTPEKSHLISLLGNGPVELRCFDKTHEKMITWSSVFDNYNYLRQAIVYGMKQGWDIYHTLNPLKIPATNGKLQPYVRTTRDMDIECYRTLFLDFDIVNKEAGTTDAQILEAQSLANTITDYLSSFSVPTIGISGNGVHLRYNVDFPVADKALVRGFLQGLDKRFSTDTVKIDTVVHNESRIARCLGTVNTKGGRRSCVTQVGVGVTLDIVFQDMAKSLIPPKPKRTWVKPVPHRSGDYIKNWDIAGAFKGAGLYLQPAPDTGKHWVTCFNEDAHSSTGHSDTVIWEGTWPQLKCSHDHCSHIDVLAAINYFGVENDV